MHFPDEIDLVASSRLGRASERASLREDELSDQPAAQPAALCSQLRRQLRSKLLGPRNGARETSNPFFLTELALAPRGCNPQHVILRFRYLFGRPRWTISTDFERVRNGHVLCAFAYVQGAPVTPPRKLSWARAGNTSEGPV